MPITIKSPPDYGWEIMALFGVSHSLIADAKAAGLKCVQSTPGVFLVKNSIQTFATIPIKGSAISHAKENTLGPSAKAAFKANFEEALNKAIAGSPKTSNPEPAHAAPVSAWPVSASTPDPAALKVPDLMKNKVSPIAASSGAVPIKLQFATDVYQPVLGTTAGSVYHVFAIYPGLSLAAKWTPGKMKLSVRVEGDSLSNFGKGLAEAFKMDKGAGYYSQHYKLDEGMPMILMTLGAIFGTLGMTKATKLADPGEFAAYILKKAGA